MLLRLTEGVLELISLSSTRGARVREELIKKLSTPAGREGGTRKQMRFPDAGLTVHVMEKFTFFFGKVWQTRWLNALNFNYFRV